MVGSIFFRFISRDIIIASKTTFNNRQTQKFTVILVFKPLWVLNTAETRTSSPFCLMHAGII